VTENTNHDGTKAKAEIIVRTVRRTGVEVQQEWCDCSPEGTGNLVRILWRGSALFSQGTEAHFRGLGQASPPTQSCTYDPEREVVRADLTVGTKWSVSSRCTVKSTSGGDQEQKYTSDNEVTNTGVIRVGSADVPVVTIRRVERYNISGPGIQSDNTATIIESFSPDLGYVMAADRTLANGKRSSSRLLSYTTPT